VAALVIAVGMAVAWMVLARDSGVRIFLYAGSWLAVGLGFAAVIHTKLSRRPGMIAAILATLIAGFAMTVGPWFRPFMEWPPSQTPIVLGDGQRYVDSELRRLGVSNASVKFLRGEVRRDDQFTFSRDHQITSYCLFEVDAVQTAALKRDLLSGAHAMGWTVNDNGDEMVRDMPWARQPSWFDPKTDPNADYLQLGSSYWFVFCPTKGQVFFWTSTD
jgi:hypothetical protein